MSRNPPAAGASGGRAPLPATFFAPEFINIEQPVLEALFRLQDPLCSHLYMLILQHSTFKTGEFLGSYARLLELCTPPAPERGKRRLGPSYKVVRDALTRLECSQLIERGNNNAEQGQLRLFIRKLPFKILGTSNRLEGRV